LRHRGSLRKDKHQQLIRRNRENTKAAHAESPLIEGEGGGAYSVEREKGGGKTGGAKLLVEDGDEPLLPFPKGKGESEDRDLVHTFFIPRKENYCEVRKREEKRLARKG